jgi:threonine dehydratase
LGNLFPGREVHAKCEFLAPSGCFKIRGAVHLLEHLSRTGNIRQLIVPSMGNTALGAAVGAKAYGFHMVGVVPTTIARAKDEKLRALGVELIKITGGGSELLQHATQVAQERGGYFVHPHLDPLWTNGYQQIAAEILQDLPGCRTLVFPVGGGGLLMGLSEYVLHHAPEVKLVGSEPFNYPKYAPFQHARSTTIADGLLLEHPHVKVQERIHSARVGIHLIEEDAIRAALAALFKTQSLAVEPSSAVPVAHVLNAGDRMEEPACIILTGENIAREDFFRLITAS